MKIKLGIVMALVFAMVLPCTGCTIGDTEYVLDMEEVVVIKDVFSINGIECTKEEARVYLCNYQNIYGHEYGVNLWEHNFGNMDVRYTLETYVKDVTLSQLANITCMSLFAKEQGVTLTEEEKALVSKAAEQYFNSLSASELEYMGVDKAKMEAIYEKYASAQKVYDTLTQGVNEEVSDDEARVIRVEQIYVETQEEADIVKAKLDSGDGFSSVATLHNAADTIEITLRRGDYPAEVDAVAFHLDNNEQSDMIVTPQGYYFIKCVNKFEYELTEENKIRIIAQRRKEQFEDNFQKFIDSSEFILNEEIWDEIEIDTSGAITTDSFFAVYDNVFKK